ncbi:MAG: hypothetical protein OEP52_05370 [Acidimicrobiia bacterium]|nr:hypothetical protein [Acidimicrobiia bacterium]
MRAAYDESGVEWDGTLTAVRQQGSAWDLDGSYCRWEPAGGGWVIARGLTPAHFGGGTLDYSEADDPLRSPGYGPVSGHPDFADDVIVANAAFGRLGFWLQGSDEALGLEVHLPVGESDDDRASPERMLSDLANSFLNEMGWTP